MVKLQIRKMVDQGLTERQQYEQLLDIVKVVDKKQWVDQYTID
jgi:hypothetical protein